MSEYKCSRNAFLKTMGGVMGAGKTAAKAIDEYIRSK